LRENDANVFEFVLKQGLMLLKKCCKTLSFCKALTKPFTKNFNRKFEVSLINAGTQIASV
jgi:hypothetical protein